MNFRQKLAYTVLGGGLMLVGMLFASLSPLTAQRDVFGNITCTGLNVVDEDGKHMVGLGYSEDAGYVDVYGKDENARVFLGISERGWGLVSVYDKDGKGAAQLSATEHGGSVGVFSNVDTKTRARLCVNSAGDGKVSTWDKHGFQTRVR